MRDELHREPGRRVGDVHARVLQDRERVARRAHLEQRAAWPIAASVARSGAASASSAARKNRAEGRIRVALVEGLRAREQAGPSEQGRDGPVPVRVGQVGQHGVELLEQCAHRARGAGGAQPVVELLGRRELGAPQRDDLGVDRGGRRQPGLHALDGAGGGRLVIRERRLR